MTTTLRVPEKRRGGFVLLARTEDVVSDEFFSLFANIPVRLYHMDVAEKVAGQVKGLPAADALEVVESILSLYGPLASTNKPIDEFVEEVLESLKLLGLEAGALSQSELSTLGARLRKLLRVPTIGLITKSLSMLFERERMLVQSRVISDARPVFGIEDDNIGGAIVVHTLKIDYVDARGEGDFFLALDEEDIDALISVLERAKRKGIQIRQMLGKANVQCIEDSFE